MSLILSQEMFQPISLFKHMRHEKNLNFSSNKFGVCTNFSLLSFEKVSYKSSLFLALTAIYLFLSKPIKQLLFVPK